MSWSHHEPHDHHRHHRGSAPHQGDHPLDVDAKEKTTKRQPLPIVALAIICCLVGVWSVFSAGIIGQDWQMYPLILSGVMLGFISLFEIRVGLAVLLLAIGLSPELSLYGVSNFRYEDLIFPILFFVWLTRHVLNRQKFQPTDLKAPILALVFLALVSSLNNHIYGELNLGTAVFRFGKGIQYYFIFIIVLNTLTTPRDLKSFVWMLILTSSVVGVYGVTQYEMFSGAGIPFRVTGPPGETANILGGYYVFHICIAVGLMTTVKTPLRIILILYVGLMLAPLIGTLSRTSYVALSLGFFVVWFISRNRALAWVLALVAIFALLAPEVTSHRFWSIFGIFDGNSPSSWIARVDGWRLFLKAFWEAPLLGHGVGRNPLGAVDNEYVLQMNELGLLGLVAFLWLIGRCLRSSVHLLPLRKTGNADPTLQGFALGYFGGLVALLVHSIGATTFTTIRTTEPFFFATGMLYAYWNLVRGPMRHTAHTDAHSFTAPPMIGRVELGKPEWLVEAEKKPQFLKRPGSPT
ncbi:MAG: O-antigen ligase family protein [Pseudomonadota bacterium]